MDLRSTDAGPQVVRAYLSRQHFEDVENSCPMTALPTDVARCGKNARRAFQTIFQAMGSVLERSLLNRGKARAATRATTPATSPATNPATTAKAVAALCVGGMVVARAMEDRARADELRDACMATALKLGGWDRKTNARNGRARRNGKSTRNSSRQ